MAIPVITDHFQLQWIWEGPSGLPEDVFITTWYFRNDAVGGSPWNSMRDAVLAWWMNIPTGGSTTVSNYIPDGITSARVKVYDLGEALPRFPVLEETVATAAGEGTQSQLPREVAVVNSYYSGQGPRKRGRNYVGPLTTGALRTPELTAPEPNPTLVDTMTRADEDLRTTSLEITWVQVSTTYGIATPVLGGWVDNAFDTQRRRGVAPSSRETWGNPPS